MRAFKMRFVVAVVTGTILGAAGMAQAQIPLLINHQGVLTVGGGNFNGTGDFKFGFIDGSTTWLWTNDGTHLGEDASIPPDAAVPIDVNRGVYSVVFGDTSIPNMVALFSSVFDGADVKLRIFFDGRRPPGEQLLSPDQVITSVPYAFRALTADTVIDPDITRDTELADHADDPSVHHEKTIDASELIQGILPDGRLSPNVTLLGASIDLPAEVTGVLPEANIDPDITRDTELTAHGAVASAHHEKTVDASELTQGMLPDARLSANVTLLGASIDLPAEVTGVLPEANIDPAITRDTELAAHGAVASAHHPKTIDASELTQGTLPDARLSANVTLLGPTIDLSSEVAGVLSETRIDAAITRDAELAYAAISAGDPGTDVTASELEELTGSGQTSLHTHAAGASGVPTGAVQMWAGNIGSPPSGWLVCNGQAVSRATYSDLFTEIGTAFGNGDGSTTFNLPDLRNRFAMGAGDKVAIADAGGEEPTVYGTGASAYCKTSGYVDGYSPGVRNDYTQTNPVQGHKHKFMPPFVGLAYIIKQ